MEKNFNENLQAQIHLANKLKWKYRILGWIMFVLVIPTLMGSVYLISIVQIKELQFPIILLMVIPVLFALRFKNKSQLAEWGFLPQQIKQTVNEN